MREIGMRRCTASAPQWLSHWVIDMEGGLSGGALLEAAARVASLAGRWHVLTAPAWDRARRASAVAVLREAQSQVEEEDRIALRAVDRAIARLSAGKSYPERLKAEAFVLAASPGSSTGKLAVVVAARTLGDYDRLAADEAAAVACRSATEAAVRSLDDAVDWKADWDSCWHGAYSAARSASWDRMATGVLGAVEAECEQAEASS